MTALQGIESRSRAGEFVSLLGPSGCGKTTALRLVAGFDRPDAGSILVDGKDVTRMPPNRRDMGMVFQAYSLFPNMTAEQNVEYGLRIRKKPKDGRRTRVRRAARARRARRRRASGIPHQLSGGMQQRVALARALAIEPSVLLLDEPLSALDAKVRVQLREEIRRIQLELGITTIYVTHDQEEALSISDRVAVMYGGKIEQVGAPAEMYGESGDTVRGGVHRHDEPPHRHGRRRRHDRLRRPASSGRRGARPATRRAGALPRAARDGRHRRSSNGATPESSVTGEVISNTFLGSTTRVRVVDESGERTLTADISTAQAAPLTVGTKVVASFPADEPSAAQPGRRASVARARSGRSVKTPSTPSACSSSRRAGSLTV